VAKYAIRGVGKPINTSGFKLAESLKGSPLTTEDLESDLEGDGPSRGDHPFAVFALLRPKVKFGEKFSHLRGQSPRGPARSLPGGSAR